MWTVLGGKWHLRGHIQSWTAYIKTVDTDVTTHPRHFRGIQSVLQPAFKQRWPLGMWTRLLLTSLGAWGNSSDRCVCSDIWKLLQLSTTLFLVSKRWAFRVLDFLSCFLNYSFAVCSFHSLPFTLYATDTDLRKQRLQCYIQSRMWGSIRYAFFSLCLICAANDHTEMNSVAKRQNNTLSRHLKNQVGSWGICRTKPRRVASCHGTTR